MNFLENRVPPPLAFAATGILMWLASLSLPAAEIPGPARWPVLVLFLLLALVGPLGIREFSRAKTTIDPVRIDRASSLVTSGVFGVTRNPMYVSMTSLLIAWAVYLATPWVFLGPLAFALFIDRFQIAPEERVMAAKFGADYDAYRARVRRWV